MASSPLLLASLADRNHTLRRQANGHRIPWPETDVGPGPGDQGSRAAKLNGVLRNVAEIDSTTNAALDQVPGRQLLRRMRAVSAMAQQLDILRPHDERN